MFKRVGAISRKVIRNSTDTYSRRDETASVRQDVDQLLPARSEIGTASRSSGPKTISDDA